MDPSNLFTFPFTLAGSFLRLTTRNARGSHRLVLGTCSNRAVSRKNDPLWAHDLCEIGLFRGEEEILYTIQSSPVRLDLIAQEARCSVVFQDTETLRFEFQGADLKILHSKLSPALHRPRADCLVVMDYPARSWQIIRSAGDTELRIEQPHDHSRMGHSGESIALSPQGIGSPGGGSLRICRYEMQWTGTLPSLVECETQRQDELKEWMRGLQDVLPGHQAAARRAWHLLWSCRVPAVGTLTRPALFMSKLWMNKVWAWDNVFNALAIVSHDPELAWDQLHLFFDHQGPNGVIPDSISDLEAVSMHVKPPVYGWAILRLIERTGEDAARPHLEALYTPLVRLTEWWFEYRDHDKNGLCQYHNGNDSGWDNATAFDIGFPNESPDLATWLILQCDALERMAQLLNRPASEGERWHSESEKRLNALLTHLWKNGRFVSKVSGKGLVSNSQSLLLRLPLLLAGRLPSEVTSAILQDLKPGGPFLTRWGLASESPASPQYEGDGYWRGPIWGVANYLFFDGLLQAGEIEYARELAGRACALCVEHPGFWENYDALSGQGLRCPSYSWSAASFLLMAQWLAANAASLLPDGQALPTNPRSHQILQPVA